MWWAGWLVALGVATLAACSPSAPPAAQPTVDIAPTVQAAVQGTMQAAAVQAGVQATMQATGPVSPEARRRIDASMQVICAQMHEPTCTSARYVDGVQAVWNGIPAYRATYELQMKDGSSVAFTGWFGEADGKYLETVNLSR